MHKACKDTQSLYNYLEDSIIKEHIIIQEDKAMPLDNSDALSNEEENTEPRPRADTHQRQPDG